MEFLANSHGRVGWNFEAFAVPSPVEPLGPKTERLDGDFFPPEPRPDSGGKLGERVIVEVEMVERFVGFL